MNTRQQQLDSDLFLDELEYLTGPVQGIYKTTKKGFTNTNPYSGVHLP